MCSVGNRDELSSYYNATERMTSRDKCILPTDVLLFIMFIQCERRDILEQDILMTVSKEGDNLFKV